MAIQESTDILHDEKILPPLLPCCNLPINIRLHEPHQLHPVLEREIRPRMGVPKILIPLVASADASSSDDHRSMACCHTFPFTMLLTCAWHTPYLAANSLWDTSPML